MIVVDASVILEVLFSTPRATRVVDRISNPTVSLHAPALIDLEVCQVVRRYVREGLIEPERGATAIQHLAEFDVSRYPSTDFLSRIWALRDNLTAYDAAYVSLAETLRAPLLTADQRLAQSPGHSAKVELL